MKTHSISRRTFLAGLAGGAALLAGGAVLAGTKFGRSAKHEMAQMLDGEAQNLRQIMTQAPATSRRIVWQAKAQLKELPGIELRDAAGSVTKTTASEASFSDDGKDVYQYEALLDGLQPGSEYTYRIVENGRAGEWQLHRDVLQYRIKRRPERKEGISSTGEALMPVFEEFGVDVVYTAHLHTYRDRGHLKGGRHDDKGPLYILTGVAGNVRYPGLWEDHALDQVIAPQPETDNYLTLKIEGDTLTTCCYLPDGTEIDRVVIQKAK